MSQLSAADIRRRTRSRTQPWILRHGISFDWVVAALSVWMLSGLYLDGWAHDHFGADLGTFFTPWHAFLYAGFSLLAAFLAINFVVGIRQTTPWRQALPGGYLPSLVGVGLFFVGAVGDLVWHTLFGIEVDVEALYSPTHLLLATAALMILSGPLRAGMQRAAPERGSWGTTGPAVVSVTVLLALFIFFTESFQPFAHAWAASGNRPGQPVLAVAHLMPALLNHHGIQALDMVREVGLSGFLLQAVALTGALLTGIRCWGLRLPLGSLALITGAGTLLVGIEHDEQVLMPAAVLGALAVEALYGWLRPSVGRIAHLRVFAAAAPVALYAFYFADLGTTGGTWWSVHLWGGAIFLAGGLGLLVSFLVFPPVFPPERVPVPPVDA